MNKCSHSGEWLPLTLKVSCVKFAETTAYVYAMKQIVKSVQHI